MSPKPQTIALLFVALCPLLEAQYTINTVAGGGPLDGTVALHASIATPAGVARDAAGNLYVASNSGNRVFKIDPKGVLSVFAGNGNAGYSGDGEPAVSASLSEPFGVAVDTSGNVYIADSFNGRIRKVTNGVITTVAGVVGGIFPGPLGDGGPATSANLFMPHGIAVDSRGNLYIADTFNNRIRKVSGGIISTIAGNGTFGFSGDNGPATSAALFEPRGVAVDSSGNNVYIADSTNDRIRKVSDGVIATVAGTTGNVSLPGDNVPATSAALCSPLSVAVDGAGNLYITDTCNNRIRKVTNGLVATVAGNGSGIFSGDNGPAVNAGISTPLGITVDGAGNFYVSDDQRVRSVSGGVITSIAGNGRTSYSGDGGPAVGAQLTNPRGVALDNLGNLYIADTDNHAIRKVTNGIIANFAGTGHDYVHFGDNGPANSATVFYPNGVSADTNGNIFIADTGNGLIREVSGGVITTVAGNGGIGFSGDNGPATSAQIGNPTGVLVVDGAPPTLYIADGSSRVRSVASRVITTFAGGGSQGLGDDGLATNASLSPTTVAFRGGEFFIADSFHNRVRKVSSSNVITTVAGGGASYPGDGGLATSAIFMLPTGVALDAAGNLFVTDTVDHRICEITNGSIATIAGPGIQGFSGDGGPATSASLSRPTGIAVDAFGNIYFADSSNDRVRVLTPAPTNLLTLSPPSTPAGTSSLTLTVNGTGFFSGIVIMWNGAPLPTTFINTTQITTVVPGSLLNVAGTATVSVNGSNSVAFSILPPTVSNAIAVSPSALQFGTAAGGTLVTSPQSINVQAPPGATWNATSTQSFLSVSPSSGTGNGSFTVSIVPSALPSGDSVGGTVTVSAAGQASATVNVTISIGASTKPVGNFDTPVDGTTNIAGAIPVSGWALDNIEVVKVDIWREPVTGEGSGPNGLVYVGDAVFVAGARPDVQALYPNLPFNYRGGWGYQMLTNFLPNAAGSGPSGNGIYKLHAIAHNKAGATLDLGTKTITVDNAHASKPFGTIDTPGQGGTPSGNAYINFGWALTQNPNIILIDGSTIKVVVDGQAIGHPTYNNFRSDIAALFPGYMNSGGAVGFYYLDTTKLATGVHTISWNVFDNAGHGEGIGSRYFNVFNSSAGSVAATEQDVMEPTTITMAHAVEIEEAGHLEIPLGAMGGYQLINGERAPLPIGSSLKRGVFFWQPGPGFLGDYTLVFERRNGTTVPVHVRIRPKNYK